MGNISEKEKLLNWPFIVGRFFYNETVLTHG